MSLRCIQDLHYRKWRLCQNAEKNMQERTSFRNELVGHRVGISFVLKFYSFVVLMQKNSLPYI